MFVCMYVCTHSWDRHISSGICWRAFARLAHMGTMCVTHDELLELDDELLLLLLLLEDDEQELLDEELLLEEDLYMHH